MVSDDRYIVLDVWIAIEKLVSPAKYEDSGKQKDQRGDSESNAQRRKGLLFNHRNDRGHLASN
jgi:hypothetical protein